MRFGFPRISVRPNRTHPYFLSFLVRISQATAKARTQGFTPPDTVTRTYGPYGSDLDSSSSYNRVVPIPSSTASLTRPLSGHRDPNQQAHLKTQAEATDATRLSPGPAMGEAPQRSADPLDMLKPDTLEALSSIGIDTKLFGDLLRLAARPAIQENSPGGRDAPQSAPAASQQFSPGDAQFAQRTSASAARGSPHSAGPARPITITPGQHPSNQERAQARALLASMMGANSMVPNSMDPYNTTVRMRRTFVISSSECCQLGFCRRLVWAHY